MKVSTPRLRRSFSSVAAAALALMIFSTTAYAAWHFLKPSDVANQFADATLSAAFEGESAININDAISSGGYTFTLLAVVSGEDITNNPTYNDNGDVFSDRTYTVLAIQNEDGSPMTTGSDDNSFYASLYVKGLKPWQVNAHTLNGGYSETVVDGVLYRIIECDEVAMFADRGIYLGVNTGSFYNSEAFRFDEATGVIAANTDFDGASVVFDLPISKSLADPQKAQDYLDTLLDFTASSTDGIISAQSIEAVGGNDAQLGSKRVMTYDEYKFWVDQKLAETQALVDQGKYSASAMELDRRDYESNLEDMENGATLTMIENEDGSRFVSLSFPGNDSSGEVAPYYGGITPNN